MLLDELFASRRPATPAARSARIESPPDSRGRVAVTVPSETGRRLQVKGCPIAPRVELGAGGAVTIRQPARGDRALVVVDEGGDGWVIGWEPRS
jgi:hypothetical protein